VSNERYDDLETRDPKQRERAQFDLPPDFLRDAVSHGPGWTAQLKGADLDAVTSRQALARLPVLRKSELKEMQARGPSAASRHLPWPRNAFDGRAEQSLRTRRRLRALTRRSHHERDWF
jgi:hypothetical protein